MISGEDRATLREAIRKSFDPDDFDILLDSRLERTLHDEAPNAKFPVQIQAVLKNADRNDWEAALILALIAERPKVKDFQAIYSKYFSSLYNQDPETKVRFDGLQALVNNNPLFQIGPFLEFLSNTTRHVCRIEVPLVNGSSWGTGFLLGKEHLMTNYHVVRKVIKGEADLKKVVCKFDYAVTNDGVDINAGIDVGLAEQDTFAAYSELCEYDIEGSPTVDVPWPPDKLDYALVKLNKPVGDLPFGINAARAEGVSEEKRGWVVPPNPRVTLQAGGNLFIFQHPSSSPLKLGIGLNGIIATDANNRRVRHSINTQKGSSGSPMFDDKYRWVGLHNMGDPEYTAQYNQGIQAIRILEDLERKHITL